MEWSDIDCVAATKIICLFQHISKCREFPCSKTPHCCETQYLKEHISSCYETTSCAYPHCMFTRSTLNHYQNCRNKPTCPVCSPRNKSQLCSEQEEEEEEEENKNLAVNSLLLLASGGCSESSSQPMEVIETSPAMDELTQADSPSSHPLRPKSTKRLPLEQERTDKLEVEIVTTNVTENQPIDSAKKTKDLKHCLILFNHSLKCSKSDCILKSCSLMKGYVQHQKNCSPNLVSSSSSPSCQLCQKVSKLYHSHSLSCKNSSCSVPLCQKINS
jgi:hypothetical protein